MKQEMGSDLLCFPGFLDLFNDGYSELAMIIQKKNSHPDLIKNKQPDTTDTLKNIHAIRRQFP